MSLNNINKKENISDNPNHTGPDSDNDTYGHILVPTVFSRKDEPVPSEPHIEQKGLQNSEELKNINLANNDSIASRMAEKEKGIGGKNL